MPTSTGGRILDTISFLNFVLPPEGNGDYIVWKPGKSKGGINTNHATIEEAVTRLDKISKDNQQSYIFIGTSVADSNKRTRDKVQVYKSIAVDIDCGIKNNVERAYATPNDAIIAVAQFCKSTGFPPPLFVNSGYGLHCWWAMDELLWVTEYETAQQQLSHILLANGIHIDKAVGLTSQVLRAPGTRNWRSLQDNQPVFVIPNSPTVTHSKVGFLATLETWSKHYQYTPNVSQIVFKENNKVKSVLDTRTMKADPDLLLANCGQVAFMAQYQGSIGREAWRLLLSLAAYTTSPEATAISWSQAHPTYTKEECLSVLNGWEGTGPALCATLNAKGQPNICPECKLWGKISTPLQAARVFQEEITNEEVIGLPDEYKLTDSGIVFTNGDFEREIYPINFWIESIHQLTDTYACTIAYQQSFDRSLRNSFSLPLTAMSAGHDRELSKVFSDNGLIIGAIEMSDVTRYLQTFKRNLSSQREYSIERKMGWSENFDYITIGQLSFNIATKEWFKNFHGSENQLVNKLGMHGDIKNWVSMTSLLDAPDFFPQAFAVMMGLAAPLMIFSPFKGITVMLHGESNTGKTTGLRLASSVVGHPDNHIASDSSPIAIRDALVNSRHFAVCADEVTNIKEEGVSNLLYAVTQGKDKSRFKESAREEWATYLITSSNASFLHKMQGSAEGRDAEALRLIEIECETQDAQRSVAIHEVINENYGLAMPAMIRCIAEFTPRMIRDHIKKYTNLIVDRYQIPADSRFIINGMAVALLAGMIAKKNGIINFNPLTVMDEIGKEMHRQRFLVSNNNYPIGSKIAEYVNAYPDCFHVIFGVYDRNTKIIDYKHNSYAAERTPIRGEFIIIKNNKDEIMPDKCHILFSEKEFTKWGRDSRIIAKTNMHKSLIREGLVSPYSTPYRKMTIGNKLTLDNKLTGGGAIAGYQIELNHPLFQEILERYSLGKRTTVLRSV